MAMANDSITKAAAVSLLLACSMIIMASPYGAKAEISCPQIVMLLTPCIPYGVLGGTVPPGCCQGVKKSMALVKTTEDLRAKCQCVKDVSAGIPGLNYTRVNQLPAICKTTVPYVVSPKTDCSKLTLPPN